MPQTIALSSAAATANQTVCVNAAITNITYNVGGGATGANASGLPLGVTGSFNAGVFTISGTPTTATGSPFNYTVTTSGPPPCTPVTIPGRITVNPAPNLVIVDPPAICSPPGTVNITTATVQTTNTGTTTTYWSDVAGTIAIPAADGTPAAISVSGTYYIKSAFGAAGCSVIKPVIVTINPAQTITLSSAAGTDGQTVCANNAITNITYTIAGGANNAGVTGLPTGVTGSFSGGVLTITGAPTTTGPFTYQITTSGPGPCPAATATGTITVNQNVTIALSSGSDAQNVCLGSAIGAIQYAVTGPAGTTTAVLSGAPPGVTGLLAGGFFTISGTPTTSTGSPFTYIVTTGGGCTNPTIGGTITVTSPPTLVTVNPPAVCLPGTANITTTAVQTSNTGATTTYWSDAAATVPIPPADGTPGAISASGTYYIKSANGTCAVVAPVVVSLNPPPTVTLAASATPICLGSTAILKATNSGGTLNPVVSGTNVNAVNITTGAGTFTSSIALGTGALTAATNITISFQSNYPGAGDLTFTLISPCGTTTILNLVGGTNKFVAGNVYTFASAVLLSRN